MRIRWTRPAAADLARICDYSQRHFGPAQSRRTALLIYEAAEALKINPKRGRRGRRQETRELVIPSLPFLIVYRLNKGVIEITRILHGAQKWP